MTEHDELLHEAFGEEVEALTIGPSPMAAVMRDGAVLRTRRRAAFVAGAATLAVLPVAAVAVFSGGGGAKTGAVQGATSGPATTTAQPTPGPPPITVTAPAAGQGNPDLSNDQVVVLTSGTFQGKAWRLVRDRYVEGTSREKIQGHVKDAAHPQPHISFDQWGKAGTFECESVGPQWGDKAPASWPDFNVGSSCAEGAKASLDDVSGLIRVLGAMTSPDGDELMGRVDATKVASVAVALEGEVPQRLPVAVVSGEKNGYLLFLAPHSQSGTDKFVITAYDAQGVQLGQQEFTSPTHTSTPPASTSTSTPTSTPKK